MANLSKVVHRRILGFYADIDTNTVVLHLDNGQYISFSTLGDLLIEQGSYL